MMQNDLITPLTFEKRFKIQFDDEKLKKNL